MATFIARTLRVAGEDVSPPAERQFSDVDGVHADNIEGLAALGVARGTGGGEFSPTRSVTRAQMATFIVRALEALGVDLPDSGSAFDDVSTSDVHGEAIGRLAAAGVVQGRGGGVYDPGGDVTRAQMASFLMRSVDLLVADGIVEVPYCGVAPTILRRQGSIDTPGEAHDFELALQEGQRVAFEPDAGFSRQWRLVRAETQQQSEEEVFDARMGPDRVVEVEESGDYILEIYSSGTTTGSYSFELTDVTEPTCIHEITGLPHEVAEDFPVAGLGRLTIPGEYHDFELVLQEGQRVAFEPDAGFSRQWRLYRPEGDQQEELFDARMGPDRVVEVEESGDYILEVYSSGATTGTYSFELTDVS